MGNPELSHQIGQTSHNVKEAGRVLLDSNLFQNLQDIGHPYGLLLNQSKGVNNLSSELPSEEFLFGLSDKSADFLFPVPKIEGIKNVSMRYPSDLVDGLSEFSINHQSTALSGSLIFAKPLSEKSGKIGMSSAGLSQSSLGEEDDWTKKSNVKGSLYGFGLAWSFSSFTRKMEVKPKPAAVTLAPMFLKLLATKDIIPERQREFRIGRSRVNLGTTSIRFKDYKGDEPFSIKTPEGEPVTQINPGDVLGSVHVSRQAGFLNKLTPLEKINTVTDDLLALFSAIEETGLTDISVKAQQTLEKAKSATIIGISHLVRLFRRKTGLPTWKLDILPEAIQRLHQLDSQVVSKKFGGNRQVRPEDIEMLVITPAQRQMLVATA